MDLSCNALDSLLAPDRRRGILPTCLLRADCVGISSLGFPRSFEAPIAPHAWPPQGLQRVAHGLSGCAHHLPERAAFSQMARRRSSLLLRRLIRDGQCRACLALALRLRGRESTRLTETASASSWPALS